MWNVAAGHESYSGDHGKHDVILDDLVAKGLWEKDGPILTFENILFSDSGAAYLGGYNSAGMPAEGLVYTMRKCFKTL